MHLIKNLTTSNTILSMATGYSTHSPTNRRIIEYLNAFFIKHSMSAKYEWMNGLRCTKVYIIIQCVWAEWGSSQRSDLISLRHRIVCLLMDYSTHYRNGFWSSLNRNKIHSNVTPLKPYPKISMKQLSELRFDKHEIFSLPISIYKFNLASKTSYT